jgi:hypothetical protein
MIAQILTLTDRVEYITFDAGVKEAKGIIASQQKDIWRMAEIVYRLEPKYGEKTLAKFANAVDLEERTIRKYRQVWEKFGQNGLRGPFSSLVELTALSTEEVKEIIHKDPKITKRKAAVIAKKKRPPRRKPVLNPSMIASRVVDMLDDTRKAVARDKEFKVVLKHLDDVNEPQYKELLAAFDRAVKSLEDMRESLTKKAKHIKFNKPGEIQ